MTCNQVIIHMGRAALLRRIQRRLYCEKPWAATAQTTMDTEQLDPSTEEKLACECVMAAYRIIDLLRFLSLSKKLARYSFTDINCCSSAAIIVIINEIICPDPTYDSALSSILHCLQHMSSGCQNARHGLRLVQNLLALVAVAMGRNKSLTSQSNVPKGSEPEFGHGSGYMEWEIWLKETEISSVGAQRSSRNNDLVPAEQGMQAWQEHPTIVQNQSGFRDQAISMTTTAGYTGNLFSLSQPESDMSYTWPDNLNFLGLSAFEGLEFPANTLDAVTRPMEE